MEHTKLENTGYAWDSETETISPQSGSNNYTKAFPMLHFRYKLTPTTNLRLAGTTDLQRPNFFDMAPYRIRDDEDIELGNPDLKPAYSYNADLMLEHYIRPLGVVSLGGFYKDIRDPIYGFTSDNEFGGDTDQPGNGKEARIAGFEIAYQQQFKFLPAPLNGLGIYTNYTYANSETTLPDGRKARVAGQADHILNAALSYERGFFSGQFSVNYTDDFVDEFGGDIGGGVQEAYSDVFVDNHLQFDLTMNFRLTQQFALYVEWINMTNERWRLYQAEEIRPIQREFYETSFWVGFNFSR
jgi:TonB-dependent receptor